MESSTSKIAANVLIVTAILLISTSLVTVLTKKPPVIVVATTTPEEPTKQPTQQESLVIATTTTATTTEVALIATSTATTTITIAGFTDKSWTWIKTSATGTKSIIPKKVTAFTITFNNDGTIKGTTDCNSFFGNYKLDASKISFGPLGTTKMFCDGSQEADFMNTLQSIKEYSLDKTKQLILITSSSTMTFK